MIQTIIARLAGQSTAVKGWCVTVTAAFLGFGVSNTSSMISMIAIYVVLAFAILDAYYHALERAYRSLYDRAVADEAPTWSLTINRPTIADVGDALKSPVILILYGASLSATMAVSAYILSK